MSTNPFPLIATLFY